LSAQPTALTLEHHDSPHAQALADDLSLIYREAYAGTDEEHDPFHSAERFLQRFAGYSRAPGFELVTARAADAVLVGYVFGYTLPVGARWWNGLLDAVPAGFTEETGSRTFAINELHVRAPWRGRGVASRLHHELVDHRPEERVTLLVVPDNPARSSYLHWGYRPVSRLRPFPDSPTYEALVLPLPRAGAPSLAG